MRNAEKAGTFRFYKVHHFQGIHRANGGQTDQHPRRRAQQRRRHRRGLQGVLQSELVNLTHAPEKLLG